MPTIPKDLKQVMRKSYEKLMDFVLEKNFKALVNEMYNLPPIKRPLFVKQVFLNPKFLKSAGIKVPKGILIQRSAFGDGRPTLFVVKTYLPKKYQVAWENVNITFDQEFQDKKISRSPENSWKKPLPFELQAALAAMELTNKDLEALLE